MRGTEVDDTGGRALVRTGAVLGIACLALAAPALDLGRTAARVAHADDPKVERQLKRLESDRKTRIAIDAAIGRAAAFLRACQRPDGVFLGTAGEYDESSDSAHAGQTLLCALALQKAGGTASADSVERAARWALTSDLPRLHRVERYVYAAAIGLTLVCGMPSSSYAQVRVRLANALVAGQDRATGWWGYDTPGGDLDVAYATREPQGEADGHPFSAFEPNLSTTQYAVMGLRAAAKTGMRIPRSVWSRHTDAMLRTQLGSGSWPYRPVDTSERRHLFDRVGYCCGTFMGLSSLLTAAECELSSDRRTSERQARIESAVSGALQAMGSHGRLVLKDPWMFDPDAIGREAIARSREDSASPGVGAFYTLLALERACVFANIQRLANPVSGRLSKDEQRRIDAEGMWYQVGARWLIERQAPDGGWAAKPGAGKPSNLLDSALALLFLLGSLDEVAVTTPPGTSEAWPGTDRK